MAKKQKSDQRLEGLQSRPLERNSNYDLVCQRWTVPWDNTEQQATITKHGKAYSVLLSPPSPNWCQDVYHRAPPHHPKQEVPELGVDNLTLEGGVATELRPSDFVSQKYETFGRPHARGNKRDQATCLTRPDLTSVRGTKTLDTHGINECAISVRDRLVLVAMSTAGLESGAPRVKSPPSSESRNTSSKRRDEQARHRRHPDNRGAEEQALEIQETNIVRLKYEDMSVPWRRQKGRRI
ncbi:hypothetical protein Tco_0668056 [Tanacetum coccineum]